MRRANRVEPVGTGSDAGDITQATVTTTTRMEFVRRVEVVPMKDAVAQLHTDLNQSLGGNVIISPRLWTGMNRLPTPSPAQRSRRTLCLIGCLFMTVGLVALFAVVAGLTLAFGKLNTESGSDIERYDIGDLQYGMTGVSNKQLPSNTYLSEDNKAAVARYLSDQLSSEPGFRGLIIDEVLVQGPSTNKARQQRQTSCSTVFVIRNIRVFFDHCPSCTESRKLAIRRALSNITAFQKPLSLNTNNGTASRISTQICSTPNITRPIAPVRLSALQAQELNATLPAMNSTVRTTGRQRSYPTPTYSSRSSIRSSQAFTSRSIPSRKTRSTTSTTTTVPFTEISSSPMTTISDRLSTVLPTDFSTESTFTSEMTSSVTDTDVTSTVLTELASSTISETFTDISTTITEDTGTFASSSEQMTTVTEELDSSTSLDYSEGTTSSFTAVTITEELDQTSTDDNTSPSAVSYDTNASTESGDTSSEDSSTIESTSSDAETDVSTTEEFIGSTTSSGDDLTSTMDYAAYQSTTGIEEMSSVSSNEPLSSTSSSDDLTATPSDSMASEYSSTAETDLTTSAMSDVQSSTVSTYLDETSDTSTSRLTTTRPLTTYAQTTARTKLPINNRLRPTPGRILPVQPFQPTSSLRNISFTMVSMKPDRTRQPTWYFTGVASMNKSRYGSSMAITPSTTYQTKPFFGRRGNTTTTPLTSTGRIALRFESTATIQRGRFRGSMGTFKQTTPVPTRTRPQTTIVTRYQTTALDSSTVAPSFASDSSTDTIESTTVTDADLETSSLLAIDQTSTADASETTSSDISTEETSVVSAARLLGDLQRLPFTSPASVAVASVESSSFTTIDTSDILSVLSTNMAQGEQSPRFMANSPPLSDLSFHTETDPTVGATTIASSSRFAAHSRFKEITGVSRIPSTMTFSSVTSQTSETTEPTWSLTPSPMASNDDFSSPASMSNYVTNHPFNTLSLPADDMKMTPSIVVHSFTLDETSVKPRMTAVSEDQESSEGIAHLPSMYINAAPTDPRIADQTDSSAHFPVIDIHSITPATSSAVESSSEDVSNIRTVTPPLDIGTTISGVSEARLLLPLTNGAASSTSVGISTLDSEPSIMANSSMTAP